MTATQQSPQRSTTIPRVLSIAGSDPSGGAGIQADLKAIAACGGYGMAAVTALTAQNTRGVQGIHVPPAGFLAEQLNAVSNDVAIDAVKIGMLAGRQTILAVADWLEAARPPVVVLDPVMVATSGDRLLDAAAESALLDLLGRADVLTPNIPELAVLLGEERAATWEEAIRQARRLSKEHEVLVLAKGGHLEGSECRDALVDATTGSADTGEATAEFTAPRLATSNTHGTGCSLSAAVATLRPRLGGWEPATRQAKAWLTESIREADALQVGRGHGPIHHFAGLWERGLGAASPVPDDGAAPSADPAPAAVVGTGSGTDAEAIASEWWDGIGRVRAGVDGCAFIRGLAEGTVSRDAFTWYLGQDALYLLDYSRALATASALAPTPAEQLFWAHSAHGAIAAELELHAGFLGGDLTASEPAPTTTGYVNHLLAASARGDYGELIAAALPCFWIYTDVGTRLVEYAAEGNPYAQWLRTYGDPAFAEATAQAIRLVTEYAAGATSEVRKRMWKAFEVSAKHELAFFEAPLERESVGFDE